ncbi:MAG: 3-deoxy-manno-octulosonate cytidylyltransferase (CMP-KDO synthetase) [Verrucomicrobiales bacterium]|jgi:3-deoxy-manno-octulosonate cytidylyltransferase (CMP-KDO synthetase)
MGENASLILGAIPARWGSTRFPGKSLHLIAGKPLVQHVWERCQECQQLDRVVIATDDDRIREAAEGFGAEVAMTSPDHPSGTDRIAEVALQFPDHGAIINIQGDEPLIDPVLIDNLAQQLLDDSKLEMVTAANPLEDLDLLDDPNVVKVVLNRSSEAIYFSRSCIPFRRNAVEGLEFFRHKGIYGYQRDFLLRFVTWPPSLLEQSEGLEQLRALENNARIHVVITGDDSPGVDTPEQARIVDRQITAG